MLTNQFLNIFLITTLTLIGLSLACTRVPKEHGRRQQGDNGYRIVTGEDTEFYKPGKIYSVFLVGNSTNSIFTHFTFNALASSAADRESAIVTLGNPKRTGRFQLFSDVFGKFDENCVNTIIEVSDEPKTEVQIMWVAPASGSGCVALSAMVYESTNNWYSNDGQLTKILCEEVSQRETGECCACDEAKYDFTFEGIWSNETHPKDYPFAVWLTHFSDVIGASHDGNFSFWGLNHIATDGFRSLAEWGSVRLLETELRAKGSRLRTLVKAAGLWYPSVNTNTTSKFRTDRVHHKLSLVSMFGPSPDWVVGVNGLNLCKADCSWIDSLDIDLYPWDAGTDNGISYMSPNSETQPRERMYQITTMYPEDPRQPFYNMDSEKMIPLAKLYIRKEKNIPRNCDDKFLETQVLDVSENTEGSDRVECRVTDFTQWTPCSVTCGKGIRVRKREYVDSQLAEQFKCNRQLINKEMCVADIAECEAQEDDDIEENLAKSTANVDEAGEGIGICRTSPWSEWSPCSVTCGIGISMRTRTFINHAGRKKCPHIFVVEKEKCMKPECTLAEVEIPDPMCSVTLWSDWSPCSATCGNGVQVRTRILLVDNDVQKKCSERINLFQQQKCTVRETCIFDQKFVDEICAMAPDIGPCRGIYHRYAYNQSTETCDKFAYSGCRGNRNNFLTEEECLQTCTKTQVSSSTRNSTEQLARLSAPEPVDCVMSNWTDWSACSITCGNGGYSEKYRHIISPAQNGGVECPKKTKKRRRCYTPVC